jgi:broad specificity phosphatase PhoE
MMGRRALLAVGAAALLLGGCTVRVNRSVPGEAHVPAPGLTVVVVRHAERADTSPDAPLSDVGRQRAELLANVLADAGVVAIYTTQYQRTVDTAAPLARRLSLQSQVVDASAGAAHAAEVAARVREHTEGTVLVVGHSNTVAAIVRELGGAEVVVTDGDYAHLFILRITAQGVRLIRASY